MIDSYLRAKRIDSFYKSESLKEARSSGKKIGFSVGDSFEIKKSKETKQKIMLYSKDFSGEMSDSYFIKEFGISRNTFYKYKSELKNRVILLPKKETLYIRIVF